jgi:DNA-binding PadR family transcriptional regulator
MERHVMTDTRSSILQGTLDLMVLKTLEQMGPLHGYGIARRIEQVGQDKLIVNQGTDPESIIRSCRDRFIR